MKVLFYSVKDYERPYLDGTLDQQSSLFYTERPLSIHTAELAKGYDVVSVFTNDDCSEEILVLLHEYGIKSITTRAAGHDNIDLKKARSLGVKVANVPAYSPYAIAEHAVTLILALNRKLIIADRRVKSYDFRIEDLIGFDLHGKTIGVIGVGRIGGVFAGIMRGFGCRILGYDISVNETLKNQLRIEYVDLPELCRQSDIISIHTGLSPTTKYLIDEKLINMMKKSVMIVNTGRGACVKTADIIAGLETGHIGFFGMDVYENEKGIFFHDHSTTQLNDPMLKKLISMPNVLITPHQAFATREALKNIATTTFYNITCWEKGLRCENEL